MKMAAKICQIIIDRRQLLQQHTAHLAGRIGGGIGGLRFDQINDGLRLRQIQLAV